VRSPASAQQPIPPSLSTITHTCLSRVCDTCPKIQCLPKAQNGTQTSGGGTSKAALAGAVVAALIFLAALLGGIWYMQKRRKAQRLAREKALEPAPEVPASADDVLRRQDPHEKSRATSTPSNNTRVYDNQSLTTINLAPTSTQAPSMNRTEAQTSLRNPFGDQSSLGSGRTEESQQNDIQIAMVPYGSVQSPGAQSANLPASPTSAQSGVPSRPARSPEVSVRLNSAPYDLSHVNVSDDNFSKNGIPASVRSGMTTGSGASYLSTGTYATDFLNPESPTVVMRQEGKILGLSRAQVVAVPTGATPQLSPVASSHLMPMDRRASRATNGRSPLAHSSFTPDDIPEEQALNSPFADSNAAHHNLSPMSTSYHDNRSIRTTGSNVWNDTDSVASGVEASITSATRVIIRSDGRLTSPLASPTMQSHHSLSQYSSRSGHRLSFASEASSRADSILEAFPFVPPSVPGSPMTIQTFRSQQSQAQSQTRSPQPRSPLSAHQAAGNDSEELEPPNRRGQGVSIYSARSDASLGDYPVQLHINSPASETRSTLPSRASLDTLALSRDLAAYPLAFDEARTPTRDGYPNQGPSSGGN
jgi:hypothetical protein